MPPSAYFYRQCLISRTDESVTAQMIEHWAPILRLASDIRTSTLLRVVHELKKRSRATEEAAQVLGSTRGVLCLRGDR